MRQYDRAVELLEPLFEEGELNDEGSFTLFTLYLNLDRVDGAKKVAQKLIETSPEDVRGYLALGAVYEREEQPALAEKTYRAGLEVDPEQPSLYEAIARLQPLAEGLEGRARGAARAARGDAGRSRRADAHRADPRRRGRARAGDQGARDARRRSTPSSPARSSGSACSTTRPGATTTRSRASRRSRAAAPAARAIRSATRTRSATSSAWCTKRPAAATPRSRSSSRCRRARRASSRRAPRWRASTSGARTGTARPRS